MFNWFKKKPQQNPFLDAVNKHGVSATAKSVADRLIKEHLTDYSLAYQFILQELDGAAHGDGVAIAFVNMSSIDESEYDGAIYRDKPEPVEKAADFLIALTAAVMPDMKLSIDLRLSILANVMKHYRIGTPPF